MQKTWIRQHVTDLCGSWGTWKVFLSSVLASCIFFCYQLRNNNKYFFPPTVSFLIITIFLHSSKWFNSWEDVSKLSHPFRPFFFIVLPFCLFFWQHLLEHLLKTKYLAYKTGKRTYYSRWKKILKTDGTYLQWLLHNFKILPEY